MVAVGFKGFQIFHPETPYFELFIAATLYDEDFPYSRHYEEFPSASQKLPIKWEIDSKDVMNLDTIKMRLTCEVDYYAVVRDHPDNYWITTHYVIHNKGRVDSLSYGMGCGTGIFMTPIESGEVLLEREWNRLLWSPNSYDGLNIQNDSLPRDLQNYFGDSVELYWTFWVYMVPWSNYPPQSVQSPKIMIDIPDVITHWKARRGQRCFLPYHPEK